MAIPHVAAGLPAELRPQEETLGEAKTYALVKNDDFEAIRMVVPRDYEACHEHSVPGPMTVQCLAGEIAFTSDGQTHTLREGQWSYLPGGVPHTIKGVEDSLILLTIMFR